MTGMRNTRGLRIVAGALKGRRLTAPPGLTTRPLPDRVKQALFDWLGQQMDGLHVADCCAGSGAFTFEALSRGARRVDAIEPDRQAVSALRANAVKLGKPSGFVLHPLPFQAVLPQLRRVDVIFADPPFPWYTNEPGLITELMCLAAEALSPTGRLVLRGERGIRLAEVPAGLLERERRTYGRSWLAMFQRVVNTDTGSPSDASP